MLGDITLGQYYPGNSPVHRMDPRSKLLLTIAYIVGVFLISNWRSVFCGSSCAFRGSAFPICCAG